MGVMKRLFGEGPQDCTVTNAGVGTCSITDEGLHKDIQSIVDIIWQNLNKQKQDAIVVNLGHNSVYNSDIYELTFTYDSRTCVIVFNDLPGDDNFTVKADVDGNQYTPDDIYECMVDYVDDTPASGIKKFTIKRGHPSETGVLHFSNISEEEAYKTICYIKMCLIK